MVQPQDLFIDTAAGLASLCAQLQASEWIALDTEFMRERTYYPRLCLLQVATPAVIACVDPLALNSLEPLLQVIYDTRITKVLHAAYQDLEICYHLRGAPPQPVFDTQIAASLLGFGEQIGYANLVQQVLGVQLAKTHTRSDWCLRPLDAAQICYAADDVRYLSQLYPRLLSMLAEKDRLEWLADDFAHLGNAQSYQPDVENAWQRIGGAQTLAPRQLNILRALAAWREQEAAGRNLPRKWVIADQLLLDLARLAPRDLDALARLRGLQKNQLERYDAAILGIINQALQEPESTWPKPPPRRLLTPEQDATVDMLMALTRKQAALHDVSPAAIATRSTLERLVLGDEDVPILHGWRAQIAGRVLQEMLQGNLRIGVQGGALRVEDAGTSGD
jgi:ribonuclease D